MPSPSLSVVTGVPTHWHEAFSTSFVVQALLSLQDEPI
jgi:hypothetical protein